MADINFHISGTEIETLYEWWNEHKNGCSMNGKLSVQVFLFQDFSSGIGVNTIARCKCGAEKEITDYNLW